jgi:formylglycine-generating enzyme required for sulfatase activity
LRTEATNAQYKRCVDAGVCDALPNPGWDKPPNAKKPVAYVDWPQAKRYAEWVGGRLPTEAEWEYACRGNDGRIYPWGNQEPAPDRLNYSPSNISATIDVGSYAAGANGLYDMAGNVYEWTADWYDDKYYANPPTLNPKGPDSGEYRVLRGGSFDLSRHFVLCAYRGGFGPVVRDLNVYPSQRGHRPHLLRRSKLCSVLL